MHHSSPTCSPQENKPDSKPSEMSPRELVENAMNSVIMEMMQLRRTLWLILQKTGPVEVDESQCHPLWRMKASRLGPTHARLEATQLPEPTEEQLAGIVETLHGSRATLEEAMHTTALVDHPPAYIEMLLRSKIMQNDEGYWVDSALARIAQLPPSDKN